MIINISIQGVSASQLATGGVILAFPDFSLGIPSSAQLSPMSRASCKAVFNSLPNIKYKFVVLYNSRIYWRSEYIDTNDKKQLDIHCFFITQDFSEQEIEGFINLPIVQKTEKPKARVEISSVQINVLRNRIELMGEGNALIGRTTIPAIGGGGIIGQVHIFKYTHNIEINPTGDYTNSNKFIDIAPLHKLKINFNNNLIDFISLSCKPKMSEKATETIERKLNEKIKKIINRKLQEILKDGYDEYSDVVSIMVTNVEYIHSHSLRFNLCLGAPTNVYAGLILGKIFGR